MDVRRLLPFKPGEGRLVLLSGLYFFLLLFSYYLLRPLRETFGLARGADTLPWVWTCTLGVMALVQPLFGWLVARMPRRRFIPWTGHASALCLLVFAGLYLGLPHHGGTLLGYVFYVWLSVFNLFVVSIFWAFMADLFDGEQAGRLFGLLAIGGTVGAIAGSAFTEAFTRMSHLDPGWLFLLSALMLEGAVACTLGLFRHRAGEAAVARTPEPGPRLMEGITLLGRSRTLQLIALYMLLFTLTSTFLYVLQGRVVEAAFPTRVGRTLAFARLDLWTNVLTLACQLFLTHRLVARFGVPVALMILPVLTVAGFAGLALWPGFLMLAVFQVLRRGLHYAVARPVREMLYVPLGADAKYKAKSFIDTFIYRAGDLLGIWMTPVLSALRLPLMGPGVCVALLWQWGAWRLGRRVER